MNILDHLAYSLARRDELPNKELATKIVKTNDKAAVKQVVANLSNPNKNIQADCIKVLDEIAMLAPLLVGKYFDDMINLLAHKNNRMVWGAMIVINNITNDLPSKVYEALPKLIDVVNAGSVITRDHFIAILIKLEQQDEYRGDIFPLILEQLTTAPENQLPSYAEQVLTVINDNNKDAFRNTLVERLTTISAGSKLKRVQKVLEKLKKAGLHSS